jgi:hypothetical protein
MTKKEQDKQRFLEVFREGLERAEEALNRGRCEIDLLRCDPRGFLEGLKPRSVPELVHLSRELGERRLHRRASLALAYASFVDNFESAE